MGEVRAGMAAKRRGLTRLSLDELNALLQVVESGRPGNRHDLRSAVRQLRSARERRARVVEKAKAA